MSKKGFTLVELLIVIAIIAIIASVVLVAIDPARRFAEARNATRSSDVSAILGAVMKYQVDNDGTHLTTVANLTAGDYYYQIGTATTGCNKTCPTGKTTQSACCDLSGLVDAYIGEIPEDPKTGSGTGATTDYYINKSTNGRITIGACTPEAEGGTTPTIKVTQ